MSRKERSSEVIPQPKRETLPTVPYVNLGRGSRILSVFLRYATMTCNRIPLHF